MALGCVDGCVLVSVLLSVRVIVRVWAFNGHMPVVRWSIGEVHVRR